MLEALPHVRDSNHVHVYNSNVCVVAGYESPGRLHVPALHGRGRHERDAVGDCRILGLEVDALALLGHEVPEVDQKDEDKIR